MTESTQNPIGRPTAFLPDFHPADLLHLAAQGKSVAQFCSKWGIGNTTFYEWIKRYPEFRDAYARARMIINAFWMDKAEEGMVEEGDAGSYRKTNHNVLKMLWGAHSISSDDRAIIIPGFAEAKNPADKRNCVLDALAAGEITASEADKFLGVLERGLKIGEATEVLERLAKLEEASGIQTGN